MIRNLDNLRGDAKSAGAEHHAKLSGFTFDSSNDAIVMVTYELTSCPRDCAIHCPPKRRRTLSDAMESACRTLRQMGWKVSVTETDDGVPALVVFDVDGGDR